MTLKDYLQGNRRGKDANKLEREAMNDPFLQDAMEGFDAVTGDHLADLKKLEKELSNYKEKKKNHIRWWIMAAAASAILILSIGGLWNYNFTPVPTVAFESSYSDTTNTKMLAKKNNIISDTLKINTKKIVAQRTIKQKLAHDIPTAGEKTIAYESDKETIQLNEIIYEMKIDSQKEIVSNESFQIDKATIVSTSRSVQNAKTTSIYGKVIDENNEPIIGATINIKETNNRTITDINGNYKLEVPNNSKASKLTASFIGYAKNEVQIKSDSNIIKLSPENIALNEVVVVGYGVQKRTSITGAVSRIESTTDFGEKEFKEYYNKCRNKALCNTNNSVLKARFTINQIGAANDIIVETAPCQEMEAEFIKILKQSPAWTIRNKQRKIIIKF